MKKLTKFSIFMVIGCMLILSACAGKNSNVEGSLTELMERVYQDISEDEKPMYLENIEVTDENIEMYLGTKDISYEEALASESMVGSVAYSVVLVRTKDDADIEATKATIKENVDPRKWICVGVEPEHVIVKNKGNVIIVIIVEDETLRNKIEKGFDNL